jgi:uncharacterized protein (DUF697 family)
MTDAVLAHPVKLEALSVVGRHAAYVAAAGLIPVWWIGSPSIAGLQLKMLADVSRVYGIDFEENVARPMLASLAGGSLSYLISQSPLSLALRNSVLAIPLIGVALRFAMGPAIMAGYTYVLGSAFVEHYENGGSYRDFRIGEFKESVLQFSANVLS